VLAGKFERVGFAAAVGCEVFERIPRVLILLSRRVFSFSSFFFGSP
jgi:hypothetical protein